MHGWRMTLEGGGDLLDSREMLWAFQSLKTSGSRSRLRTCVGVVCELGHPVGTATSLLEAPAASSNSSSYQCLDHECFSTTTCTKSQL